MKSHRSKPLSPVPRADRRQFLRGAAYALALPFLPSLVGRGVFSERGAPDAADAAKAVSAARPFAKRLVCVGTLLGFYKSEFFGSAEDPRLLRPLADLRGHFTTISGLDHKGPTGRGHDLAHTVFTGSAAPGISLDQAAAAQLGIATRYESLQIVAGESQPRPILSFTSSGMPLPATRQPSTLFAQIFGAGSLAQETQAYVLSSGQSLLDELRGDARALRDRASREDRDKLGEYFESVRGLERRLERRQEWLDRGYPTPPEGFTPPSADVPDGSRLLETSDLMWDLLALALQNDSTRVISYCIPFTFRPLVMNGAAMKVSYHAYSHHGHDPQKIDALLAIEEHHTRGLARFLRTLRDTPDGEAGSLLDSTVVVVGSAMGDAASHRRINYPMMVAGGGFKHRHHLHCAGSETPVAPGEQAPNEMACDLYVSVLQRLGIEAAQFGSSTSDLNSWLV